MSKEENKLIIERYESSSHGMFSIYISANGML